jgi:hypothetical protein
MTDFATEVAFYEAMTPKALDAVVDGTERAVRQLQARLAAMRKAQRRQATLAKGGKLPQHTKPA